MSQRRIAAVQAGLLFVALFANAAVKNNTIRIQVLDSETQSVVLDDSGVPKNCDAVNFDAYCHNSKTVEVTNTLLVQEGNKSPFRVACTVDTKWSSCVALAKATSFDAQRNKRGLVIYYADAKGKVRKQLYLLVGPEEANATAALTATPAPSPAPVEKREQAPVRTAIASLPEQPVKCSFSSTPSGAEVTVDGRYVGSTPSVLSLITGDHAVEVSLPGFAQWKRELTVSKGSELTVNAVLEKVQ